MQREMQEQKLLHSQLRDEASSEFRSLYRKAGNHEKDVDLLKYQLKMSTKKVPLNYLEWINFRVDKILRVEDRKFSRGLNIANQPVFT